MFLHSHYYSMRIAPQKMSTFGSWLSVRRTILSSSTPQPSVSATRSTKYVPLFTENIEVTRPDLWIAFHSWPEFHFSFVSILPMGSLLKSNVIVSDGPSLAYWMSVNASHTFCLGIADSAQRVNLIFFIPYGSSNRIVLFPDALERHCQGALVILSNSSSV